MSSAAATAAKNQAADASQTDAPQALTLFDAEAQTAADLLPRSRVLAINGQTVSSPEEARARLRRLREPVVLYVEDERGRFFRVLERVP